MAAERICVENEQFDERFREGLPEHGPAIAGGRELGKRQSAGRHGAGAQVRENAV